MLRTHGFERNDQNYGAGIGGAHAEATYVRASRSITLWLSFNSLSVIYRDGEAEVRHIDYMRELVGVGGRKFPTCSLDVRQSFAALYDDLMTHGDDFLSGSGERLRQAAETVRADEHDGPMTRLARIEAAARQRAAE